MTEEKVIQLPTRLKQAIRNHHALQKVTPKTKKTVERHWENKFLALKAHVREMRALEQQYAKKSSPMIKKMWQRLDKQLTLMIGE